MSSLEKILLCFIFKSSLCAPATTSPFLQVGDHLFSGFQYAVKGLFCIPFSLKIARECSVAQGQHWWFIFLPSLVSSVVAVHRYFPFCFFLRVHYMYQWVWYKGSFIACLWSVKSTGSLLLDSIGFGAPLYNTCLYNEQSKSRVKLASHSARSATSALTCVFPFCRIKSNCKQLITHHLCLYLLPLLTQKFCSFSGFCFDSSGSSHGLSPLPTGWYFA